MRLEGRRGLIDLPCPDCNIRSPTYRCEDCAEGEILCASCILARHKRLPLHLIKVGYSVLLTRTHINSSFGSTGTVRFLKEQRCVVWDLRFNLAIVLMRLAVPLYAAASSSYTRTVYTKYKSRSVAVVLTSSFGLNFFDTHGGRQHQQILRRVRRAKLCVFFTY